MVRPSSCLALLLFAVPLAAAQPIPRNVDGYAVFADSLVRTKGQLTVDGAPIGVNAGSLLTHGPLAADHVDVVTAAGPANAVRLRPGSQCSRLFTDPARVTGVNCSASPVAAFTGPIIDEALATACGFPETFPSCAGGATTVGHGAVVHLSGGAANAPKAYGDVTVLGAPHPGMLVLDGGAYAFCSLAVASRATLLAGSAVQVFVAGDLRLATDASAGPGTSPGAPVAGGVRFLVAGKRAHLSQRAHFTGHVCAPDGTLSMAAGAEASGGLAAHVVSTDRATVHGIPEAPPTTTTTTSTSSTSITATTTTSTSSSTSSTSITVTTTTTSTTMPSCVCGDGIVDSAAGCFEQCDLGSPGEGLAGVPCPDGQACVDCRCVAPPTTTTSSTSSTTTTTLPCRCGDGIVNPSPACGEQCDSANGSVVDQCPSGSTCDAACKCGPTEPVVPPQEICGCLPPALTLAIRSGAMHRRGKGTRVDLHSLLAKSAREPDPRHADVYVQIRRGTDELLCARVPAGKFMRMRGGRVIGFWDYSHHVASAQHIDDLAFTFRKDGSVKVHVFGRRVKFPTPPGDDLTITVALKNPSAPASSQCWGVTQSFRTTRTKGLRVP